MIPEAVRTPAAGSAVAVFAAAGVAASALLWSAGAAHAQAPKYPTKPIRILVTLGPGSAGDNLSRLMADGLSRNLGQQVIVDNRPGAGGNVAAELTARAAPDGYTLFITTISTHGINPTLYGKLNFDPIKDFAPIILAASSPNMLVVHPSLPVKSVKEFIALARQKPGEITFSSGGTGTSQHMAGELFGLLTGSKLVHIPYKSTPLSINAVLSGETMSSFASVSVVSGIVQSGKLRTLGVTNAKRIPSLPDLPTIAESGVPGFAIAAWFGFSATGGTPEPIINLLNVEMRKVLQDPVNRQKLAAQGMDVLDSTPAEFAAYIRSEIELWGKVVKAAGARAE